MDLKRKNYQRTTSWNAPYTFSGKEKDVETGYGYFGARYYDSGLSIWLSVDPMSDKYPSMSPYNYCANNPVILVDPDGRDWYEAEDGKSINFVYGETGERKGYKHLGANLDQQYVDKINNGDYSSLSISANFQNEDFVPQKDGQCCKAANQMCTNRGGKKTNYGNELQIVTRGENGSAGVNGIKSNLFSAIKSVGESLIKGIPVVAGVDFVGGTDNPTSNGGDGMADHYVAIIGITLNFTKGANGASISSGTIQYANPGNSSPTKGLNPANLFSFSANSNWKVERKEYKQTMTNIRVR